jgi:hypothetical protein
MEDRIMRKLAVLCILGAVALWLTVATGAAEGPKCKAPQLGKLRHVVLLKFKDGTSAEQVKKIEDGFRALPKKIPEVVGFEWGTDNSPEKLSQGFTHCFLVTFNCEKGRAAYLPHPAHKAFVEVLKPHLDKVLVIDYVAQD